MIAIGLMSGTSCDGLAAAALRLRPGRRVAGFQRYRCRLLACRRLAYPSAFRRELHALASGAPAGAEAIGRAASRLSGWAARGAAAVIREAGLTPSRVTVIGDSGHTLSHRPNPPDRFTSQAADPSLIAERTGVTTVGDFRRRDVAAGGQGAPLAPYGHWVLFAGPEPRVVLNLGGIANVTWLPSSSDPRSVTAFDTGPANVLLDLLVRRASRGRAAFDPEGRMAASGKVHARTLAGLNRSSFLRRPPPKSTGCEAFGEPLLGRFARLPLPHALATATEFTARTVAFAVNRWLPRTARRADVLVSGGGGRNRELMRRLRAALAPRLVIRLADLGWPDQAVEPACFALLAAARLAGRPNVLPGTTGAARSCSAGVIAPRA